MKRHAKAKLRRRVRLAAAHLDDIELDRAFEFALQGDMDSVERVLSRCSTANATSERTVSWRETSSWLFGRDPFPIKRD